VLAGVTDPARSRRALAFVAATLATPRGPATGELDDDPTQSRYISPYISSGELLARFDLGDAAGALALVRREWGPMVEAGPGTIWEKVALDGTPATYSPMQTPADPFGPTGAGLTSLAHGWGGGPAPALSGYVLGIRPVTPGFATWLVAPQPGDLRWAQGQAPTPHGPISSRWERGDGDRSFVLTVAAPAGTTGTVAVPLLGGRGAIAMDGRVIWDGDRPAPGVTATLAGDTVRVDGLAGSHTFAWVR
jgi:hypothetical protein